MRALLVLITACGPIYPAQPQPQPPPTTSGPPGETAPDEPPSSPDEPSPDEPATTPAPAGPKGTLPAQFQALLDSHNRMRAKHCAKPLAWSPKLASVAQAWANSLRDRGCKFEHSGGQSYGENLAGGTAGALDGEAITKMWYDEVKLYDFRRGGFSMDTGHFTQVVWRDTRAVGCGVSQCNGMDLWVCNYDPPGNVETMYQENVVPPGCK